jgi:hypothetical protein
MSSPSVVEVLKQNLKSDPDLKFVMEKEKNVNKVTSKHHF